MLAALPVFRRIELRNEWQTDDDFVFMLGVGGEPYEVVYDLLVALTRVGLIDGWVHVLDVDDEGMDEGSHFLQVATRYVQTLS